MGFSIASRKQRGGIGIHLAGAVVVAVAYVFLNKFSETWTLGYAPKSYDRRLVTQCAFCRDCLVNDLARTKVESCNVSFALVE